MKSIILFRLLFFSTKSYSPVEQIPCSQCVWQWLDVCCLRVKCENQMNYTLGVDGYGASGYCHGVLPGVDIWLPGNWTYICSPKSGLVVLTLFADKRCDVDSNPWGFCNNPTTCP